VRLLRFIEEARKIVDFAPFEQPLHIAIACAGTASN
jgi:hypothetical protein